MVRSAAAALALVILPGIAGAQERAVHRVAGGETLWSLAQQYYDDPWMWPQIYEANRSVVEDPHWIYPGEELVIPDAVMARPVQEVVVSPVSPAQPAPRPVPTTTAREPERTVFYQAEGAAAFGELDAMAQRRFAVPREISYAAPWLGPLLEDPQYIGSLVEFAGAEDERVPRETALPFDRIRVTFDDGASPPRGSRLLAFRVERSLPGVGRVLIPTAILSVSDPIDGGAIALVVDVFERLTMGNLVLPLPDFTMQPGARSVPATVSGEAVVLGFAADHAIQNMHDIAFLDRGAADGVRVGDEYIALWNEYAGGPPEIEGRLQVVSVHRDHSSARIISIRNPIFEQGMSVRLDRTMP